MRAARARAARERCDVVRLMGAMVRVPQPRFTQQPTVVAMVDEREEGARRKLEDDCGTPIASVTNIDEVSVLDISVAAFESHNRECTLEGVGVLLTSKKDPWAFRVARRLSP